MALLFPWEVVPPKMMNEPSVVDEACGEVAARRRFRRCQFGPRSRTDIERPQVTERAEALASVDDQSAGLIPRGRVQAADLWLDARRRDVQPACRCNPKRLRVLESRGLLGEAGELYQAVIDRIVDGGRAVPGRRPGHRRDVAPLQAGQIEPPCIVEEEAPLAGPDHHLVSDGIVNRIVAETRFGRSARGDQTTPILRIDVERPDVVQKPAASAASENDDLPADRIIDGTAVASRFGRLTGGRCDVAPLPVLGARSRGSEKADRKSQCF